MSAAAAAEGVDMQLKKAFQDLQVQMIETKQRLRQGELISDAQKSQIRVAEITKQELLTLPETTPTYQAVGRMFVRRSVTESVSAQDKRMSVAQEKIASIQKHREYLEKSMKDAEGNLRDMVQSRQAR
uniref:Prefoldin subunit 1 n=1 Tax=Plectus sambesii TaxID=2011161 RepID=A0A914XE50_9BILA